MRVNGRLLLVGGAVGALVLAWALSEEGPLRRLWQENTYVLDLGEALDVAQAHRDDLGISLVFVVDASDNMAQPLAEGGENKSYRSVRTLVALMEMLGEALRKLPPDVPLQLGVVRVRDEAEVLMPLTPLTSDDFPKVSRRITDYWHWLPSGQAALGEGLRLGASLLVRSGTMLRSMVVIAGGRTTVGVRPTLVLNALRYDRNTHGLSGPAVRTADIQVRVVGIGLDPYDEDSFEWYGARVVRANGKARLQEMLRGLIGADITRLEAPPP